MKKIMTLAISVILLIAGCESKPNTESRTIVKGGTTELTFQVTCV